MLLRRTLMPFTMSEALENDKQLKCEALMCSTRPKIISKVSAFCDITFNLMIITKSLNSYHFYHRGYVCSVGSVLKLPLDTYSKSKRTTPHFGK